MSIKRGSRVAKENKARSISLPDCDYMVKVIEVACYWPGKDAMNRIEIPETDLHKHAQLFLTMMQKPSKVEKVACQ